MVCLPWKQKGLSARKWPLLHCMHLSPTKRPCIMTYNRTEEDFTSAPRRRKAIKTEGGRGDGQGIFRVIEGWHIDTHTCVSLPPRTLQPEGFSGSKLVWHLTQCCRAPRASLEPAILANLQKTDALSLRDFAETRVDSDFVLCLDAAPSLVKTRGRARFYRNF